MTFLRALIIVGIAAACGGCSAVPFTEPALPVTAAARTGGSWMAPDAARIDLLYVSDYASNDVYAYSYPGGKLRGVLSGVLRHFVLPVGLCTDGAGNVFIPDNADATVQEYPHGGTRPVKTLLDPDQLPYSCAVDSSTGNLAVVNHESRSGPGGVSIYAQARGRPKRYVYGFVYKYYFAAYDRGGNLYVDASYDVAGDPFAFLELRKGSKSLQGLTLDQSFGVPGGVAWDGGHVVVGDAKRAVVYRFVFQGSAGKKVGATRLQTARHVAQFLIDGSRLAAAEFGARRVGFWNYPAGGGPAGQIAGLHFPFGVALSRASRSNVVRRPAKLAVTR